ncbi:MAG TPA: cyclic nucleotide-binding domain-containing protein, partial [Candidatus Limnocylindrales bacterium]
SGVAEQVLEGGPGLGDLSDGPEVRAALIEALRAPEPATRETAAFLLGRSRSPVATDSLVAVLDDPDPFVRGTAISGVLGAHESRAAAPPDIARAEAGLVAELNGSDLERVAGLRAMDRLGRTPGPVLEAELIDASAASVRAMAMTTFRHAPSASRDDVLIRGLGDPEAVVRSAAAATLAFREPIPKVVVDRLALGDIDEQEAAIIALGPHGAETHDPLLHDAIVVWADRQVARANALTDGVEELRARMASDDPTARFLADVIAQRIERHQRLALGAMTALGAPAAGGVIRRCLRSTDPEIRAQAVEALDSVGDRRLGGAIARLVEHVPSSGNGTPEPVPLRLRDDADPWIRALARRIDAGGDAMPETAPWTTHLDTMLRLRSVPMFERLSPEDLLRVALVARERTYEDGERLVREGEIGHEMFVILAGTVVVLRRQDDGTERRMRTYGAGDHVGELAVLRDRPRAATLVAEGGPVTTLIIDGDGLTAILRERPEAAMAMLATLAERIGTQ